MTPSEINWAIFEARKGRDIKESKVEKVNNRKSRIHIVFSDGEEFSIDYTPKYKSEKWKMN